MSSTELCSQLLDETYFGLRTVKDDFGSTYAIAFNYQELFEAVKWYIEENLYELECWFITEQIRKLNSVTVEEADLFSAVDEAQYQMSEEKFLVFLKLMLGKDGFDSFVREAIEYAGAEGLLSYNGDVVGFTELSTDLKEFMFAEYDLGNTDLSELRFFEI